jgi:hypothetical protein
MANVSSKLYILKNGSSLLGNLVFRDCTIYGGVLNESFEGTAYPPAMVVALTNNLIQYSTLTFFQDCGDQSFVDVEVWNNLFQGCVVTLQNYGNSDWNAYDNLFDSSVLPSSCIPNGHNGYVTNYTMLSGSQGGDVILTNTPVYQTSWLGNYYYPTNDGMLSTLIDAGSRYASNAGLFHYTTTTNQVTEGATMVDIGFHYVATDSNGNPLDYADDGIPDYLEDTNGDGVYDSGDLGNWLVYNSPNGLTTTNGLQVFTPLH